MNIIFGSGQKSFRMYILHTLISSLKILPFFSEKCVMSPFCEFWGSHNLTPLPPFPQLLCNEHNDDRDIISIDIIHFSESYEVIKRLVDNGKIEIVLQAQYVFNWNALFMILHCKSKYTMIGLLVNTGKKEATLYKLLNVRLRIGKFRFWEWWW